MLWRSSLRYLLKHPLQIGLSIIGVALGVAVVVGIDLSIQSASRAFEVSTDKIAGKATHRIVGADGYVPDSVYTVLRADRGIRKIAPVIESRAKGERSKANVTMMGVDPFAEPPFRPYLNDLRSGRGRQLSQFMTHPAGVLMSEQTAADLQVKKGDSLRIRVKERSAWVQVIGLLKAGDDYGRQMLEDLVITDISTAQRVARMPGKLSYIDVIISQDKSGDDKKQTIQSELPIGVELQRSDARPSAVEKMISSFKTNLRALSLLALIVGMFLIYNTMTFSVLQRRSQIGRLQAIGVTKNEIFRLILAEAGLIGVIGTLVGGMAGYVLGGGLVELVARTINDIYFELSVAEVSLTPWIVAKGIVLGVGATLITAVLPARMAMRTSPRISMARSSIEESVRNKLPHLTAAGIFFLALGGGILLYPSEQIWLGYLGMFPVILGYALIVPVSILGLVAFFRWMSRHVTALPGRMAVQNIRDQLSRSSVAIAALCIAVAATIGVSTSISSFRDTVEHWLEYRLQADVFISGADDAAGRQAGEITDSTYNAVAEADEVREVHTLLRAKKLYDGSVIHVEAIEITERGRQRYRFKTKDPGEAWASFEQGQVWVSEPMAYDHRLQVGDSLTLKTQLGKQPFEVGGIFYDYSSDVGTVLMSRKTYDRYWDQPGYTSLSVIGDEGIDAKSLSNSLKQLFISEDLNIRSNRELRTLSMEIFDQTFAITRVLQFLIILVALIGVFSALMALQLERTGEIGVLKAIGFVPGQIRNIMIGQTVSMGAMAGLLSLPLGGVLAWVLVHVINKRSFGWTLQLSWSYEVWIQAMAIAVGAALLAGIYPAYRLGRINVVEALQARRE